MVLFLPAQYGSLAQIRQGAAMEYKNVSFEIKNVNPETGSFEGYASVFDNVDADMDIIAAGAFSDSIAKRMSSGNKPKMLWQHKTDEIIGVWDEFTEDDRGLFVKGRLLVDVTKGREALALMRHGALDGMSVGFMTEAATEEGPSGSVRRIIKVDLWEVSLVTWGANNQARVTSVKELKQIRDVEQILRDAGVPNKFAKLVAIHGYDEATKRLKDGQRDADVDGEDGEAMVALLNLVKQRQETFNVR